MTDADTPRYWLVMEDGIPINLLRLHAPEGFTVIEVWYQNEWLDTPATQAELDGLGGDSDYRRIARKDEERLVPRFKASLNYESGPPAT